MKSFFFKPKSEKSSDIIQPSSNAEIENAKTSEKELKNTNNSEESIYVNIESSKRQFSLSQLTVIGVITVAIIGTFFLVTRGNDFCIFSVCTELPFQNSVVYNVASVAAGLGGFVIFGLLGASAPIAIIGSLATWFLMQISSH